MTSSDWRPSATLDAVQQRAELYRGLREFFYQRQVTEVDVPSLSRAAVSDPHIDSINAQVCGEALYLQTSPEFFMKRLLAAGCGDIYSLNKAFRNGEAGRRHNPEFTMLEWYRRGWDDQRLMDEVAELIGACVELSSVQRLSYREVFQRELGLDPHIASVGELQHVARQLCDIQWDDDDRDVWLDVLMTHVIEPGLGDGLVLVYDFPASQAALARLGVDAQGQQVARRFEAYVGGVELANGYWELCDGQEQAQRLQSDLRKRQALDLPQYPVDQHLIEALTAGLPDCAGVALGVDRLLMLTTGINDIRQLLAFPFERV
ncbi:EF-P lysine aminoacylase GenX [Aestuariicella hydrocarbonica]|uniref:EF-P lysine aminoacylase GenX n=1 Tax=Pseudomaricurvus hydrocarbonicus TaxID=1470433 RepID=A0A9E5MMK2_9GAMM|nr:EF-P lysine aminoacylase EpmA [Aestuariicella hydrocarbonica]NHO66995.1 EF-P lysine aminoacylase GenX [Aestuariicella hydrocarbonica]